jgi:uncharacterized repeat protein (TIGR03803 family)
MKELSLLLLGLVLAYTTSAYAVTETVLHSFTSTECSNAVNYPLLNAGSGLFYGACQNGGTNNNGVVYSITSTGTYTDIYDFPTTGPVVDPSGPLIMDSAGNLYGTSSGNAGSGNAGGALWKLSQSGGVWTFTDLHTFTTLGFTPQGGAALNPLTNTLFGTTMGSGSGAGCNTSGCGTIWSYNLSTGAFNQLHNFVLTDGGKPFATLVGNNLPSGIHIYGTTSTGGTGGGGTAFMFTPTATSGTLTTLYNFTGGSDGNAPNSAMTFSPNGLKLYGSTPSGGVTCNGSGGLLFSLTGFPAVTEATEYPFVCDPDGQSPSGPLLFDVNGNIYGVTSGGGPYHFSQGGTAFKLTLSGGTYTESVMYQFGSASSDGWKPVGGMVIYSGSFYGVSANGGTNNSGTVYKITP